MSALRRVALATFTIVGSVGLVLVLVLLGSASEGPLSAFLGRIGAGVSEAESKLLRTIRGPGRAAELGWLEPLRTSADALREPGPLLLGAYDEGMPGTLEPVLQLERALGTTFPLIHLYTAWGDAPEHEFPERAARAIRELGSIPVITWEPWLATFESRLHPHLPLRDDRDRGGLAAVARGDYDMYVDAWAREAARYGTPIMVRFAHEMNDPYRYPWGPHQNGVGDFVAAWRHVVDRFRAAGATNVVWAWSPHVAYEGYEAYWPGDGYVDWVATGALNYGTVAYWSRWWTFDEIFGRHYETLLAFGRPVMVAELGSLSTGGDRAAWYADALDDLAERYPGVRAVLLFHVSSDATVTPQKLDWSLLHDPAALDAVRTTLGGGG